MALLWYAYAMRNILSISFSVIAALSIMPRAIGSTLTAGEVLVIDFSTSLPVCPSGPCNVLQLIPNEAGSFGATDVTVSLFDGPSLLGAYTNPVCCGGVFQTASSLFQGGTTVDFTSIDSGTIDGIMEMTIGTGFLTWPSSPTPILFIGWGQSPGGILVGTGLTINSVTILTPEPSTGFSLALGGLILLLGFRNSIKARG
jgi:hypothetical protein